MATKTIQIRDAMKTILQGITVANGYSVTVENVTTGRFIPPEQSRANPYLHISLQGVDYVNAHTPVQRDFPTANFQIFGIIKSNNADTAEDDTDYLAQAVQSRLDSNHTLSNLAIDTLTMRYEIAPYDEGGVWYGFSMEVQVQYEHPSDSPQG